MTADAIGWTIPHDPGATIRVAGFASEWVAGFRLECLAGFVGIRSLCMAAVAAVRCGNPAIAGFYERLRQAGKPSKLAQTACMRKLVVTLYAMQRTGTAWKQA